jgi:hypothetical protein
MVGYFQFELYIPGSGSLKEKRFVIQSLKDRIRNKFNVSIAEIDGNDTWQRSLLGIAMVSNDSQFIEKSYQKILMILDGDERIEVIDRSIEYF